MRRRSVCVQCNVVPERLLSGEQLHRDQLADERQLRKRRRGVRLVRRPHTDVFGRRMYRRVQRDDTL
jgi:hypothetical protein